MKIHLSSLFCSTSFLAIPNDTMDSWACLMMASQVMIWGKIMGVIIMLIPKLR
ncbi:hypothetical protein HanRHA438_Chr12g0562581 [Helianthus annuus]|nr:hypothetical protein HanRHA438_Chr12g0562581 [Helianthus annuus]